MNFHGYVFSEPYLSWLLQGLLMTLVISLMTTIFSLIIGIAVGMMRTSKNRFLQCCGGLYVVVFRNLPLLPFLLFMVFALPDAYKVIFGRTFPPGMEFPLLISSISLNTAGYIAEIFRSGIRAIPEGQYSAACVLGLKPWQIYWRILFPQAIRIGFPALGSRLIHNMKNSSVAVVLPLNVEYTEVIGQTARIAGQTFSWAEPLVFAAVVYLTLSLCISALVYKISLSIQLKDAIK